MLTPFNFQIGNKPAGCEDAPPIANTKWLIICDGLGGSGATKHQIIEDGEPITRTSGYCGSRIVACALDSCFDRLTNSGFIPNTLFGENREQNAKFMLNMLKEEIKAALQYKINEWNIQPVRGRTLRTFPTTMSAAVIRENEDSVDAFVMWAGDSRAYFLSPSKGLQMLTQDDAYNSDTAMLSSSEMYNCICYGWPFFFNYAYYTFDEPGILFCCSDGCFDYLKSPLHFDWLLMHTLTENVELEEGKEFPQCVAEAMMTNIYRTIGDDTTMAGVFIGIENPQDLKDAYEERLPYINEKALKMNDAIMTIRECDQALTHLRKAKASEEEIKEVVEKSNTARAQMMEVWNEYEGNYRHLYHATERGATET